MEKLHLLKYVDHTLLKPFATWEEIKNLCEESIHYNTASVCVPPTYVKDIHDTYGEKVNICTVIGFPLGYSVIEAKLEECKKAILDGANELDVVINITDLKNKKFNKIEEEIKEIKMVAGNRIIKVIIETCYLTEEEKIKMCEIVTSSKADFIKTSTGFGTGGATMEDIKLFKKHIGKDVKIKASGGVKTIEDLEAFINEGCLRIGTSSAIKIIQNK